MEILDETALEALLAEAGGGVASSAERARAGEGGSGTSADAQGGRAQATIDRFG